MLETNKQKNSVNNIELPDRASHLLPCALKTKINIEKYGRPDFFFFELRKSISQAPEKSGTISHAAV